MKKPTPKRSIKTQRVLAALALLLLINFSSMYAQTASATDAYVVMDDASSPGTFAGTYFVFLSDTTTSSEIEVSLGSNTGLNDVMTYTYVYDVASGLPGGYTYARQGNKLTLGIGNYTDRNTFFGTVRVKNSGGTWSSPFHFITN
jgi:hypothetical protein